MIDPHLPSTSTQDESERSNMNTPHATSVGALTKARSVAELSVTLSTACRYTQQPGIA